MADITDDLSTERWHYMEVTWKLRDFSRKSAKIVSLPESSSFSLAKADWILGLHQSGRISAGSEGHISIYLCRKNYSVDQQRVKATFSIRTRDGENYKSKSINRLYEPNQNVVFERLIKKLALEEEKYSLLPDGTLTVHCQIMVEPSSDDGEASEDDSEASEEELSESDYSLELDDIAALPRQHLDASSQTETSDACKGAGDPTRTSLSIQNLQSDYKKLLETGEEADVCLKVFDKEFRAHKCILKARSSVFSAMFKHDTQEKNSGEVVIEDLDPESFPDFLQHVYTGSVDSLSEENVFNLYITADKYNMTDLKSECKSCMQRTLSVDTFCDVMVVALRYKEGELLKLAIDFFSKNLTKIIVTVKWQKFLEGNVTAANELFIKALVPSTEKETKQ